MKIGNVELPTIDADAHVNEPSDLWISRLPRQYASAAPYVKWNDEKRMDMWHYGDEPVFPAWSSGHSGWSEYAPKGPARFDEVDPAAYDAKARLTRMDHYGIQAQVLYPNIALFTGGRLAKAADHKLQNLIIRAYNDWQAEWCSEDPERLLPMASLPFWDLEETLIEVQRCVELGMRGLIFSQNPAAFGLPSLVSRHWDPLWSLAESIGFSINFHIGSGDLPAGLFEEGQDLGAHAKHAIVSVGLFHANANTIANLTIGGVCHRFPKLNFVSVESGVGYLPFLLEALDWQYLNSGVHKERPEYDLLPSEYFQRQIYACFWFERSTVLHAIQQLGPDNFLYETDFPHPTSQTPGPASYAQPPNEYANELLSDLPTGQTRKILYDNAAALYGLQ